MRRSSPSSLTIPSGLPSHVGLVLLFDTEMGFPLAVMDAGGDHGHPHGGGQRRRHSCAGAADAAHLAILGTGEQAGTHLEAISLVRPLRSVRVWGRSPDKARRSPRRGLALGLEIEVCDSARRSGQERRHHLHCHRVARAGIAWGSGCARARTSISSARASSDGARSRRRARDPVALLRGLANLGARRGW